MQARAKGEVPCATSSKQSPARELRPLSCWKPAGSALARSRRCGLFQNPTRVTGQGIRQFQALGRGQKGQRDVGLGAAGRYSGKLFRGADRLQAKQDRAVRDKMKAPAHDGAGREVGHG